MYLNWGSDAGEAFEAHKDYHPFIKLVPDQNIPFPVREDLTWDNDSFYYGDRDAVFVTINHKAFEGNCGLWGITESRKYRSTPKCSGEKSDYYEVQIDTLPELSHPADEHLHALEFDYEIPAAGTERGKMADGSLAKPLKLKAKKDVASYLLDNVKKVTAGDKAYNNSVSDDGAEDFDTYEDGNLYRGMLLIARDAGYKNEDGGNVSKPVEEAVTELKIGSSETAVDALILSHEAETDLPGADFGSLQLAAKKTTKNSVKLSWKKGPDAVSYKVYGSPCGKKNSLSALAVVTKPGYTQKGLKKGTYYKYMVAAFDQDGKLLASSVMVHAATQGGKVGNCKKITTKAKKNKAVLKAGKKFSLKAKQTAEKKKLKIKVQVK
ncbi:MAG: fibronectin type III domain-containing protein [Lachnospiraceae bacterium]|nr:fibronectin type III domain-containing protein [Lachnospiraceae bacterium]